MRQSHNKQERRASSHKLEQQQPAGMSIAAAGHADTADAASLRQRRPPLATAPPQPQPQPHQQPRHANTPTHSHSHSDTHAVAEASTSIAAIRPVQVQQLHATNYGASQPVSSCAASAVASGSVVPGERAAAAPVDRSDLLLFAVMILILATGALLWLLASAGLLQPSARSPTSPQPEPHRFALRVPLESLFRGGSVESGRAASRQARCPHCDGTGGEHGKGAHRCSACDGSGSRVIQRAIAPGFVQRMRAPCAQCGGAGVVYSGPRCPHCGGSGLQLDRSPLSVPIPPGAPDGWRVRLRGAGDQQHGMARAQGAQDGDVIVTLRTAPHDRFERRGQDLHTRMQISLREALLGFERPISTLDGQQLHVESEGVTQPGAVRRFEGRGLPAFDAAAAIRANTALLSQSTTPSASSFTHLVQEWVRSVSLALYHALPLGHNAHAESLPAGDLYVHFDVRWPSKRHIHALPAQHKQLLHQLFPEDATIATPTKEGA